MKFVQERDLFRLSMSILPLVLKPYKNSTFAPIKYLNLTRQTTSMLTHVFIVIKNDLKSDVFSIQQLDEQSPARFQLVFCLESDWN